MTSNDMDYDTAPNKTLDRFFRDYWLIIVSFVLSFFVFYIFRFSEDLIYQVYIADRYLIFHMIIEYASIIMYVAAFLLVFYVGDNDKRLRMKIIAAMLLFVAFIDFWHTFYYDGMPGILTASSVQSATSFWIIARMGFAFGILAASMTSMNKLVKKPAGIAMALPPVSLAVFFLIYISFFSDYFPAMFVEGEGLTLTKQVLEYVVIGIMLVALILLLKEYHVARRRSLALFIAALIVSIFSELAFTSYASVYDTYNLLGHLYKLVASYMIFKVIFIFNIYYPYEELSKAKKEIGKYANNLENLVQQRTIEVQKANEEILKDIEYAKSIQKAIMPDKEMEFDVIRFYSEYVPFEKIGGDFFGVEDLNDEYMGFHIGDVAGHGIPAAMMTIFMKQSIISKRVYQSGLNDVFMPNVVLRNLYNEYNDTDFPYEMYAVMIYGLIHKQTRQMTFSSAGLNTLPAVIRNKGGVSFVEHRGFPICKYGKDYDPGFTNYTIALDPGDKIMFYTDGLLDARNSKGKPYGEQRLFEALEKNKKATPKEISGSVLKSLKSFSKDQEWTDDVHFFIMEIK